MGVAGHQNGRLGLTDQFQRPGVILAWITHNMSNGHRVLLALEDLILRDLATDVPVIAVAIHSAHGGRNGGQLVKDKIVHDVARMPDLIALLEELEGVGVQLAMRVR